MTSFTLPYIHNNINEYIDCKLCSNIINPYISESIYKQLSSLKKQIDGQLHNWDNIKKYTNPYEFIHTPIPNQRYAISSYIPISRSYFKMIELINTFNLFKHYENTQLTSFHLAEGPGGFIEAFINTRNNPKDCYYGITLLNNKNDVPGWKKSVDFLKYNPNVILDYGADNTGDITKLINLEYCNDKYNNKIDIITADGGFDFSVDYNHQESLSIKLIFSQIAFAISMQKIHGHFILKMFDLFTKPSVDLLYILTCIYRKVTIIKPNTSRYANSEKYIVCKDFQLTDRMPLLLKVMEIQKMLEDNTLNYIDRILNIDLPYIYINKLEEANSIFAQQQLDNIIITLGLLETPNRQYRLLSLKKNHIQKCVDWCVKFNEPHYKTIQNTNIFLSHEESPIFTFYIKLYAKN